MSQVCVTHHLIPAVFTGALLVLAVSGCGSHVSQPGPPSDRMMTTASSLPVVSRGELESLVKEGKRPLLVEFGVNFGCSRCDQMRPEMTSLAQRFEGQADVVRVDFAANRQLAVQLGATICPSYVLFDKAGVARARSFPTSADLLAVDVESVLATEGGR